MSEKKYPIGIQNFEKLRTGGYVYVDKTALVYRLVNTGSYYKKRKSTNDGWWCIFGV